MERKIPLLNEAQFERFWANVDKRPGHGPDGTCWHWTGAASRGYGSLGWKVNGKTTTFLAHRISYFLEHGTQPAQVCMHTCDNPACVNPAHLRSGTTQENVADRDQKGRGGGHLRRGKNNGRHTMPERTCRGERWHEAHDKPEVRRRKRAASARFHAANPGVYKGENNGRSKLTEQDVRNIRQEYPSMSSPKLAKKYGVSKPVILSVIHRRSWAHVE